MLVCPLYDVCSGEKNVYYCFFVFVEAELWSKPSRALYNPPRHIECPLTHSINFQLHIGEEGSPFLSGDITGQHFIQKHQILTSGISSPKQNTFSNVYWNSDFCSFVGAFAKLRKVAISFVMSTYPLVRLSACRNSVPTGRIFMEFDTWLFFENLSRKFKSRYNLTRIMGALH